MKRVIVTGSTGLIGKEVSNFLEQTGYKVIRCSRSLGYDLTDESVVKKFFSENPAEYLVNLFALNQHIDESNYPTGNDIYDISLDSVNEYLNVNVTSLFSVCREFAEVNKKGVIINFSSIYGVVSPDPSMLMDRTPELFASSKTLIIVSRGIYSIMPLVFAVEIHPSEPTNPFLAWTTP